MQNFFVTQVLAQGLLVALNNLVFFQQGSSASLKSWCLEMIFPSPQLFLINMENEYCVGMKISGHILT